MVLFTVLVSSASPGFAADRALFNERASRYREAVKDFDNIVDKVRGIDRADKSLVDRLVRATKDLELAAKNPRHQNRMFAEWRAVQKLHVEVEQTLFGTYTPHRGMQAAWERAIYRYIDFESEIFFHVENPSRGNSVQKIENSNALRSQFRSIYFAAGAR
jgi:hypothetical protein